MNRREWGSWTDGGTVMRRAGGRRRYNAMRRRRAEARREAIDRWLGEHPGAVFFPRGVPRLLAPAFGVHPSTIWRDLQFILYGGRTYNYWRGDEFLFSVTRACPGGPVLSVEDEDGNEIRGAERRRILRMLPRHCG